ncbi:6-pyruvoyl trahydropterin synthase family protein [Acanthopleuribacter pedis]|uniref:6-carboxy-5,6,7,8-tetrahydropterin synthase n=1 Tax=Acanthopleuribacter pedis TaxID=442870 RepID=A0A8J7U499_9BACT|nr:6-carboxytetrahydropterin synthase [Acanthopleuribacter pedis]MBO1319589.1 6-carboxytetrahydropterin synthase [Acanthopleuribacter pedis]
MQVFEAEFAKDRQKFSAAHFTIFEDGSVERLHGHNYRVKVTFTAALGELGLMFPFHQAKALIKALCDAWDERVIVPTACPWLDVDQSQKGQVGLHLKTPRVEKVYSFPLEDTLLLPINNVSCENLVAVFAEALARRCEEDELNYQSMTVAIGESDGQDIRMTLQKPAATK